MSDKPKSSIEKVYDTFAKYQVLSRLERSPVYDDLDTWKNQLKSIILRDLTEEDLSSFAGKVILTGGG